MIRVRDAAQAIEKIAPVELAENWDNVGLLAGRFDAPIKQILIALDLDEQTLKEAIDLRAELVVTHHPLMLGGLRRITDDTPEGALILELLSHGIAFYAAHTNMDSARGGINDLLADTLQLKNKRDMMLEDTLSGRMGDIEPMRLGDFLEHAKKMLDLPRLRYVGDREKIVRRVGVCGGSGAGFIEAAAGQCDVYLTGDVKYHQAQTAQALGLCVVDAGHFETENLVCPYFAQILQNEFPNRGVTVSVSKRNQSYIKSE